MNDLNVQQSDQIQAEVPKLSDQEELNAQEEDQVHATVPARLAQDLEVN